MRPLALTALLALCGSRVALADPCADLDGMPDGPMSAAVLPGGLGAAHRVCARNESGIGVGGFLLADTAHFYGHIIASVKMDGSYALGDRAEVFASAEIVRWDNVIAPMPSSTLGIGNIAVGASGRVATTKKSAFAVNGKLVFPAGYQNAFPLGFDLGLAGEVAPAKWLRVHGQLSGMIDGNVAKGPSETSVGFAPTLGAALRAGRVFAFDLDLLGSFGLTAAVDHIAVAPALRFSDGKRFGFELGAALPLAGAQRALAIADLRFSIRI